MRGYAYDRRDVTGRGLANAYAQTLGTIFSSGGEKPYEVEIFVAEIGDTPRTDQIYRLTYDGQVADEHGYAVMGGAADTVAAYLKEHYTEGASLADALHARRGRPGPLRRRERPGDPRRRPRGRRPRPHPDPAAQVPPAPRRPGSTALLGDRGPETPAPQPSAADGVGGVGGVRTTGRAGRRTPLPQPTAPDGDEPPIAPDLRR